MITIYTNVVTGENYNADGNLFSSTSPSMFYKNRETVRWQLCSETPDLDEYSYMGDGEETERLTPENSWTKYTGFSGLTGLSAYLTADNNFTMKLRGSLKAAVSSGSVSTISAEIEGATLATIPKTGIVTLFTHDGESETVEYSSREIANGTVTFTCASGSSVEESYSVGDVMDVGEAVYMQATLDLLESDIANGLFVFTITAYSTKLRMDIVYSDIVGLTVRGLELCIFQADVQDDSLQVLNRYLVNSFTIRSGIADVDAGTQLPETTINQAVETMHALLASGFALQYSANGTSWHDTQAGTDIYYRIRSAAGGGTWSSAIRMPSSYVYIAYASDDEGSDFSLTPTVEVSGVTIILPYIGILVTSVEISGTPSATDFADVTWSKYVGETPEIDSTTHHWFIGGVDTNVDARGFQVAILYGPTSDTGSSSTWHTTFQTGDLYMRVSIDSGATYGDPIKFIGVDGTDAPAMQLRYSATGAANTWHTTYADTDFFISVSTDGGTTWSGAMRFRGEDAENNEIEFDSVNSSNIATFDGQLPIVGVKTNLGNYYAVERNDCEILTSVTTLDVTRYLAYDNVQSFSGTWTAYAACGKKGEKGDDGTVPVYEDIIDLSGTEDGSGNVTMEAGNVYSLTATMDTILNVTGAMAGKLSSIRLFCSPGTNLMTIASTAAYEDSTLDGFEAQEQNEHIIELVGTSVTYKRIKPI